MRTKSLVERFDKRIREVLQHVPIMPPEFGKEDIPPGGTRTYEMIGLSESSSAMSLPGADRLATEIATNVERYASALIPDSTIRRNVLADDELIKLWPEDTGNRVIAEGEPDYHLATTFCFVVNKVISAKTNTQAPWRWHPDVSYNEAAAMLERVRGDDDAARVATLLRQGRYDPHIYSFCSKLTPEKAWYPFHYTVRDDGTEEWTPNAFPKHLEGLTPEFFGLPDESDDTKRKQAIAYGYELATSKWEPFAVAVLAYLERKVHAAYKAVVRIPHTIAEAITSVRSGKAAPGVEPRIYTGKTFPVPEPGFRHWRMKPPNNTQTEMLIAQDGSIEVPSPHDIRSFLTGSRIRTWWASWVLGFEREELDGYFNWNPRHIILDIFDSPPERTTVKGKTYIRPNRKQERQIANDFLFLETCILFGVDDGADRIEVEHGESLIHRYGQVKRNGRTMADVDLCAHARLAVSAVRKDFVQLPMKAFQLHADFAPLAMGTANVLRSHALGRNAWLKRGALTMPLGDFAREAGEDIVAIRRRERRRTWEYVREKVERTVAPGGFGKVHFGRDANETTAITIEPAEDLFIVYRTLLDAQARRQAYDDEATVRAALEEKRVPGRPRHMPRRKGEK